MNRILEITEEIFCFILECLQCMAIAILILLMALGSIFIVFKIVEFIGEIL